MKPAWALSLILCVVLQLGPTAASKELPSPLNLKIIEKNGKEISFGVLVDKLMGSDIICIGEKHDSEPDHAVQLQVIKALFARDENLGVGFEIFQRPFQLFLDRHIAGDLDEERLLSATEYQSRWGHNWSLYAPIVSFCRRNTIPIAALNAPKELTGRISKVGFEQLDDADKKELGPIDFNVKAHRDQWFELLGQMHGTHPGGDSNQKERSYQVMTVWDDYMAQSAAAFKKKLQLRRMVVLAGSGHVDGGFGIPDRAARYSGGKASTIRIADDQVPDKADALPTDFVIYVGDAKASPLRIAPTHRPYASPLKHRPYASPLRIAPTNGSQAAVQIDFER